MYIYILTNNDIGKISSFGNSKLSIPFQMSFEVPKATGGESIGPADKTARDNSEVSVVEGVLGVAGFWFKCYWT